MEKKWQYRVSTSGNYVNIWLDSVETFPKISTSCYDKLPEVVDGYVEISQNPEGRIKVTLYSTKEETDWILQYVPTIISILEKHIVEEIEYLQKVENKLEYLLTKGV